MKYQHKNIIFTILIIVFIYYFKLNVFSDSCNKFYLKYKPDYEKLYIDTINLYGYLDEYYEFIPAKVLHPSIYKINNVFLINKGSINNVKINSFVVNNDGFIGVVIKVYKNFSLVRLVSSDKLNLSVEINECYGTLSKKNNNYVVEDLVNCENIKVNDSVFTSKYSYSYTNVLVGHISKVEDDKLYINLSFNPYKIRYVGVINDNS